MNEKTSNLTLLERCLKAVDESLRQYGETRDAQEAADCLRSGLSALQGGIHYIKAHLSDATSTPGLHDQFAAAALTGLLAHVPWSFGEPPTEGYANAANRACCYADAMMKARVTQP